MHPHVLVVVHVDEGNARFTPRDRQNHGVFRVGEGAVFVHRQLHARSAAGRVRQRRDEDAGVGHDSGVRENTHLSEKEHEVE